MVRSAPPALLRCLVVDDHQLVAQAVGGLLSEMCGLELVAVCGSVSDALKAIEISPPDLLLLDVHLPGERWQDAAAALQRRNPAGRLIILTGMSEQFLPDPEFEPLLEAVVDKSRAWEDLVSVVSHWHQQHPQRPRLPIEAGSLPLDLLSPRERKLFEALGRGLLNKEIAQLLGLSVTTVETYRKSLSAKLCLSGAELVRAAALHRWPNTALPPEIPLPHGYHPAPP